MDVTGDLRLLLGSRHPLIVAQMNDEQRFMAFVRRAVQLLGLPLWTWSVTRGLAREGMGLQVNTVDPNTALAFIAALPDPGVFVLHDLRPALTEPIIVRRLKEFALASLPGQTIVLTGPTRGRGVGRRAAGPVAPRGRTPDPAERSGRWKARRVRCRAHPFGEGRVARGRRRVVLDRCRRRDAGWRGRPGRVEGVARRSRPRV